MPLSFIRREFLPQSEARSPGLSSWRFNSVPRKFIALDIVERTFLLIMFGLFAVRMVSSFELRPNLATLVLVVSEIIPVVVILSRKWSSAISEKPLDWALAFMGVSFPLLSAPGAPGTAIPQQFCALIMLTGLLIQISAKVILWRSFGIVAANRGIKVAGLYRFVRHPMYAGYMITHAGFLLAVPSLWNTVVYSVAFAIQIARLLKEEQLLNRDPSYQEYSARVPFRLLPGVF